MKISLKKIGKTPLNFDVEINKISFKGFLQHHNGKLYLLNAKLNGSVQTQCSRCGNDLLVESDEDIKLFICDGLYHTQDNIDEIDVIESFDAMADMDELLHSEIELIKSDYHLCSSCQDDSRM